MRKGIKILALVMALLMLVGCEKKDVPLGAAPENAITVISEAEEERLYHRLFDSEYKIELNLRMSQAEIAKLQQDYEKYSSVGSKSPIYRMADMDVTLTSPDGQRVTYTVEQVGVRMKGNTSRTDFYSEPGGVYNLIHLKLSFQETFDDEEYYGDDALTWDNDDSRRERKNRTFATLEKLDIRWNKCNDGTYIREHYAFEMFRENGVLAPRTNLASVDWADLHLGVFTIYEPVDKVFLQRNLPENMQGGDLYKCGWTANGADFTATESFGVENEDSNEFFIYDLKTNKNDSDHSALIGFITALNSGSVTKESFAELVDVDNFLSFAAVTYLLGNPDDARNNSNNFYIYFPPQGGCMLIPTDYDRCLGITHEWDPTGDGVSTDDPFSNVTAVGVLQENPLYIYSVCRGGYYTAEFAQRLQEIAKTKWVSGEFFESIFENFRALYGELTIPGKNFENSADHQTTMTTDGTDGNLRFDTYMTAKLATLDAALQRLDTTADPQIAVHFYIRADFTEWRLLPEYVMELREDGNYSIVLCGGRFKVYNAQTDRWYGYEVIESSTAELGTDVNTNIILPDSRCLVIFHPESETIAVEQLD